MDICAGELTSKAVSFFKCLSSQTKGTILRYFTENYSIHFAGSGLKTQNSLHNAFSMFCYDKKKFWALIFFTLSPKWTKNSKFLCPRHFRCSVIRNKRILGSYLLQLIIKPIFFLFLFQFVNILSPCFFASI